MVKIEPDLIYLEGIHQKPGVTEKTGQTFQDVLNRLNNAPSGKVKSSQSTRSTESILPTRTYDHPVLNQAETLLQTMEQYQQDLLNPGKNLREIEQTLARMRGQARTLKRESASLPPTLKELTDRITLTAEVERLKFNRGDYLG
ncbi:MAG: hypothetical protein HY788_11450 [Deltaproteobacteria bacterium]|nr:hypothetical protein [Deltaproteobacteria bacterium]